MSNGQHTALRVLAVAVIFALHWFPHTHAHQVTAGAAISSAGQDPAAAKQDTLLTQIAAVP